MSDPISSLQENIVQHLRLINNLKNEVALKKLEKDDQLKDIALGIIDVLDSFERIEADFIEKGLDKNEQTKKTMNRYQTIRRKLLYLLEQYGVSKIEFTDNKLIVGLCEVLETTADNNKQNDEIISVVKTGYTRGQDLIRAAQIIIVKN